jgi:hypothetical protein
VGEIIVPENYLTEMPTIPENRATEITQRISKKTALLPAWPGYGVRSYIRGKSPLAALRHVRVIDDTGTPVVVEK